MKALHSQNVAGALSTAFRVVQPLPQQAPQFQQISLALEDKLSAQSVKLGRNLTDKEEQHIEREHRKDQQTAYIVQIHEFDTNNTMEIGHTIQGMWMKVYEAIRISWVEAMKAIASISAGNSAECCVVQPSSPQHIPQSRQMSLALEDKLSAQSAKLGRNLTNEEQRIGNDHVRAQVMAVNAKTTNALLQVIQNIFEVAEVLTTNGLEAMNVIASIHHSETPSECTLAQRPLPRAACSALSLDSDSKNLEVPALGKKTSISSDKAAEAPLRSAFAVNPASASSRKRGPRSNSKLAPRPSSCNKLKEPPSKEKVKFEPSFAMKLNKPRVGNKVPKMSLMESTADDSQFRLNLETHFAKINMDHDEVHDYEEEQRIETNHRIEMQTGNILQLHEINTKNWMRIGNTVQAAWMKVHKGTLMNGVEAMKAIASISASTSPACCVVQPSPQHISQTQQISLALEDKLSAQSAKLGRQLTNEEKQLIENNHVMEQAMAINATTANAGLRIVQNNFQLAEGLTAYGLEAMKVLTSNNHSEAPSEYTLAQPPHARTEGAALFLNLDSKRVNEEEPGLGTKTSTPSDKAGETPLRTAFTVKTALASSRTR